MEFGCVDKKSLKLISLKAHHTDLTSVDVNARLTVSMEVDMWKKKSKKKTIKINFNKKKPLQSTYSQWENLEK